MLLPNPTRNTSHVRPFTGGRGAGFSLVEACIAIGLVAFCLVALLGLFQVGLSQDRSAVDQVKAVHILAALSDEFRSLGRLPYGSTNILTNGARFNLKLPKPGDAATSPTSVLVDEVGKVSQTDVSYAVYYWIAAPTQKQGIYVPYRMKAIVTWPKNATVSGPIDNPEVKNARGYVETTLEVNRG